MTAQPDDPGHQPEARPGPADWKMNGDRRRRSWRQKLMIGTFLVALLSFSGWLGKELYEIVKDQLRLNTMALVQNQEFIGSMAVEQSLQGAEIDGLGRDVERVLARQNNLWAKYVDVNSQLVRLRTLHELDRNE